MVGEKQIASAEEIVRRTLGIKPVCTFHPLYFHYNPEKHHLLVNDWKSLGA
jgi:catechol-2,3-dioxygenase